MRRTLKTLDRDLRSQYIALGLCGIANLITATANVLAAHYLFALACLIWMVNSVVWLYSTHAQQRTRDLSRLVQAMLEEKARSR
jgi:hypothetical protein